MQSELTFRSDYAHSPVGLSELTRLIYDVFEVDVSPLNRLGHDPSIVAFGWWRGDELVANVSLYERHLWLSGDYVKAYGVQSVAVRPEWRGHGLFRDLMSRALEYVDARANLVILVTGTPDLYTPFGFRSVHESSFVGTIEPGEVQTSFRRLSLENDIDVDLVLDFFGRRVPTSLEGGACDHPALFLLEAFHSSDIELVHLPSLDALIAVKDLNRPPMILLDIVASSIPSLRDIAAALGYIGGKIFVPLTPDRLSWVPDEIAPMPPKHMVRGGFPMEGKQFIFSTMRI